jgi:uncharacterized protein
MRVSIVARAVAFIASAVIASSNVRADFATFMPIPTSVAVNTLPEATPFQLGNPAWTQVTIADRTTQLANGQTNSGSWDMQTANETGPSAGRYLFTPYETGVAGVQRIDLQDPNYNTRTKTIVADGTSGFVSGDASRWTPWGGYLTAEESWGTGSVRGRLFEVTNPTIATGTGIGTDPTNFVHRSVLPRVSHEGLAFDKNNTFYFIDELNGGSIYKYESANPNATTGDNFFAAGRSSVLRVGDGNTFGATGAAAWIPFTDANGAGLAGSVVAAGNPAGTIDGRATADVAAFKGTEYNRPEDMEVQTLADGSQRIYVPTTDAQQVFSINLNNDGTTSMNVFVDRNTINAATGLAVGNALTSPDNVAIDSQGNIYIIEDQPGGQADIWFATDADRNGVAESIGRWATMSTAGAEPTGLYFDKFNPNVAYVNVQHPNSGNDRTIMISVPEPTTLGLLASLSVTGLRRRSR